MPRLEFLIGTFAVLTILMAPCARAQERVASTYAEGVSFYKTGRYREALEIFENVFGREPRNVNALYYVADCLLRTGDTSRAAFCYQQIVSSFPGTVPAQYARRALLGIARKPAGAGAGNESASSYGAGAGNGAGNSAGSGSSVYGQAAYSAGDTGAEEETVPFTRQESGHLQISCEIDGRRQDMIFDTGAGQCVASREQFEALGLTIPDDAAQGSATGVGGTVKTWQVPVEIKLGSIKRRVVIAVMDTLPTLPLLGETFFGDFQYVIDNTSNTIHFARRGTEDAPPGDTIDVPFVREDSELAVQAKVNGQPVKLFFDTGANQTVFPQSVIERTEPSQWQFKAFGTSTGVGGQQSCKAYIVESMELGGLKQYDFEVVVVEELPIPNGLLGQDFFANKKFTIDNQRNLIRFWR